MRLYQIPLPMATNAGLPCGIARAKFLRALLGYCGGYTVLPMCGGAWQDPATGKIYHENMIPVQFAFDMAKVPACTMNAILQSFQEAFPDQICAMVVDLGAVAFHTLKQKELA